MAARSGCFCLDNNTEKSASTVCMLLCQLGAFFAAAFDSAQLPAHPSSGHGSGHSVFREQNEAQNDLIAGHIWVVVVVRYKMYPI